MWLLMTTIDPAGIQKVTDTDIGVMENWSSQTYK